MACPLLRKGGHNEITLLLLLLLLRAMYGQPLNNVFF